MNHHMSGICQTCGGLIAEPGKAYGYAGPYCHCVHPRVPLFGPDRTPCQPNAPMIDNAKPVPPLAEQLQGFAARSVPLSPEQFVLWLRGYVAGNQDKALDLVREQLGKTGGAR